MSRLVLTSSGLIKFSLHVINEQTKLIKFNIEASILSSGGDTIMGRPTVKQESLALHFPSHLFNKYI